MSQTVALFVTCLVEDRDLNHQVFSYQWLVTEDHLRVGFKRLCIKLRQNPESSCIHPEHGDSAVEVHSKCVQQCSITSDDHQPIGIGGDRIARFQFPDQSGVGFHRRANHPDQMLVGGTFSVGHDDGVGGGHDGTNGTLSSVSMTD